MKWKNIPIPETILVPLVLGIALDILLSQPLIPRYLAFDLLGAIALLAGLSLIAWSVREAGLMEIESPDQLITTGPYGFSRNPMYLAWFLIYLSAILFTRSPWITILFPVALAATHFLAVLPEEKALRSKFEDSFTDYCDRVGRYL